MLEIHISDLMDIMSDMENGEMIRIGKDDAEDATYFISKVSLPTGNMEPIFVINHLGPVCPWPETRPKAFYPSPLELKAALISRDILHSQKLFIEEEDYRRYK